jgi:enolase-phosphatase E1
MKFSNISAVLSDIEGTTSSVNFVYEVLFPYFRNKLSQLPEMTAQAQVQAAFKRTVELSSEMEGKTIKSIDDILATLYRWSVEDKKITPLKTLQGILWKEGYASGELEGHVYDDVAPALKKWYDSKLTLNVFSSGSVDAQKLIFRNSVAGDLSKYFSSFYDTETGGKRECGTYRKIAASMNFPCENILFLSDVIEELQAAEDAGMQTLQLVRNGTVPPWKNRVKSFSEIDIDQ